MSSSITLYTIFILCTEYMTNKSTKDLCTQRKLDHFKWKHLTYINQFFGDMSVREIISEVYPNKCLEFKVEKAGEGFEENTEHHVLYDKTKKKKICSVDTLKLQNTNINKYDTLCQSYTLLVYFDRKMFKTHKARQMEMIQMYRDILANRTLIKKIDNEIVSNKRNKNLWADYTKDDDGEVPMDMDMSKIVRNIRDTLNKW